MGSAETCAKKKCEKLMKKQKSLKNVKKTFCDRRSVRLPEGKRVRASGGCQTRKRLSPYRRVPEGDHYRRVPEGAMRLGDIFRVHLTGG